MMSIGMRDEERRAIIGAGDELVMESVTMIRFVRTMAVVAAAALAADSTVAAPSTVQLWFTEAPQLAVTSVRMTGPNDAAVTMGRVRAGADKSVTAAVEGQLAPGHYTIAWRTMSRDGHPMRGTIPFTVR
jgi:methionine-rich copper-binding protein CopC